MRVAITGGTGFVEPVAVEDVARIAAGALVEGKLSRLTVPVVGPELLSLREVVERVGKAVGRNPKFIRIPLLVHLFLAWIFEALMKVPLLSMAQARILAEGASEPGPACQSMPEQLEPKTRFSEEQILKGLPEAGPFRWKDFRFG